VALSEAMRQVVEDQIVALNARSKQLKTKMEAGQELTDQERTELAAISDRISSLLRQLEQG